VSYSYKDDYYFDFSPVAATEWLKQDAYGVLNARVSYASAAGGWEGGVLLTPENRLKTCARPKLLFGLVPSSHAEACKAFRTRAFYTRMRFNLL
jgi:hypothetical protein